MTTAVTVTAQTLPEEAFGALVSLPTTTKLSRFQKTDSQIFSHTVNKDWRGLQVKEEELEVNFQALKAARATI